MPGDTTGTNDLRAAYAALWDSDQRMRVMVAVTTGCPLVLAAGSPLARAELAYQGPNPEDWMLNEAGIDITDLEDGVWVLEGWVRYHSPVGEDPDVSGASWAVTFRRPSVVELLRLSQDQDPWSDARVEVGPEAMAVRVWGEPLESRYEGDCDATGVGADCGGTSDPVDDLGQVPARPRAQGPQQILVMATYGASMRSEAFGWTGETGEGIYQSPVGYNLSLTGKDTNYDNVLHALRDGWHLLAPPRFDGVEQREDCPNVQTFEWWLVREVSG